MSDDERAVAWLMGNETAKSIVDRYASEVRRIADTEVQPELRLAYTGEPTIAERALIVAFAEALEKSEARMTKAIRDVRLSWRRR